MSSELLLATKNLDETKKIVDGYFWHLYGVTIDKVWEQTFRAALYKMDTANLLLAMSGLFSGLAWLSCLLPDVGGTSLDWAESARLIQAG